MVVDIDPWVIYRRIATTDVTWPVKKWTLERVRGTIKRCLPYVLIDRPDVAIGSAYLFRPLITLSRARTHTHIHTQLEEFTLTKDPMTALQQAVVTLWFHRAELQSLVPVDKWKVYAYMAGGRLAHHLTVGGTRALDLGAHEMLK